MSDEIKVGDVCVIVSSPCTCEKCSRVIGRECTVVEAEAPRLVLIRPGLAQLIFAFIITIAGEGEAKWAYAREHLRKKRPPADDEQLLRELGDDTPNKASTWDQVPGFRPKVEEPA